MVKAITEAAVWSGKLLGGYEFEVGLVPAGLPYQQAPWESDDRSIAVPNTSGSLWFRITPTGHETQVAIATFAADDAVVRCDTIDVELPHRRKGIADHVYRIAVCIFEAPVIPSGTQLPGGALFWQGRASIIC